MKFLGHVHGRQSLNEALSLLRSKGIPTFHKYSGVPRGPRRYALYVCLDSQYQDACAVLADPTHLVENQVDVAEFERISESQPFPQPILKWAGIALACAIGFYAFAVYFASLNSGPTASHF